MKLSLTTLESDENEKGVLSKQSQKCLEAQPEGYSSSVNLRGTKTLYSCTLCAKWLSPQLRSRTPEVELSLTSGLYPRTLLISVLRVS